MKLDTTQAQQLLAHLDQSARFTGQALSSGGLNAAKQCHEALGNALALAEALQAGAKADGADSTEAPAKPGV